MLMMSYSLRGLIAIRVLNILIVFAKISNVSNMWVSAYIANN